MLANNNTCKIQKLHSVTVLCPTGRQSHPPWMVHRAHIYFTRRNLSSITITLSLSALSALSSLAAFSSAVRQLLFCMVAVVPGEGSIVCVPPQAVNMHHLGSSPGTDSCKSIDDTEQSRQHLIRHFPGALQLKRPSAYHSGVVQPDLVPGLVLGLSNAAGTAAT